MMVDFLVRQTHIAPLPERTAWLTGAKTLKNSLAVGAFAAGLAIAGAAHAETDTDTGGASAHSYPTPNNHNGYGAFSIRSTGVVPAAAGQVIAGMYDDAGHHAHFTTKASDKEVYRLACNTSAYNDRLGDRAHLVAVTWYPAAWGSIPFGASFQTTDYPWDLPRPQGSAHSFPNGGTGGQTFTNTFGNIDDGSASEFEPFGSLMAEGMIYSCGIPGMTEEGGCVRPNTKYNIDFVIQAVTNPRHPDHPNPGNGHFLGSACNVAAAGKIESSSK